jgi:hypothetical protein
LEVLRVDSATAAGFSEIVSPGEVAMLTVAHDDDCPKLLGGDCACTPDIYLSDERVGAPMV